MGKMPDDNADDVVLCGVCTRYRDEMGVTDTEPTGVTVTEPTGVTHESIFSVELRFVFCILLSDLRSVFESYNSKKDTQLRNITFDTDLPGFVSGFVFFLKRVTFCFCLSARLSTVIFKLSII